MWPPKRQQWSFGFIQKIILTGIACACCASRNRCSLARAEASCSSQRQTLFLVHSRRLCKHCTLDPQNCGVPFGFPSKAMDSLSYTTPKMGCLPHGPPILELVAFLHPGGLRLLRRLKSSPPARKLSKNQKFQRVSGVPTGLWSSVFSRGEERPWRRHTPPAPLPGAVSSPVPSGPSKVPGPGSGRRRLGGFPQEK